MAPPDRRSGSTRLLGALLVILGGALLRRGRGDAAPSPVARSGAKPPPGPDQARPSRAADRQTETPGYEVRDTKASAVGLVMLVGVLVIAGSIAGLFVMIGQFRARDARHAPLTAQQQAVIRPPGPPLQAHPLVDLAAQRKRQDELLRAYAWADAAHTRARIPIDRAVALVIGKPLDPAP